MQYWLNIDGDRFEDTAPDEYRASISTIDVVNVAQNDVVVGISDEEPVGDLTVYIINCYPK